MMSNFGVQINWKRLRRLRRLSVVPRWAVIPTVRRQNVAEHTFHVIWITEFLLQYVVENTMNVFQVLRDAATHEEAESVSGDISAPYKRGPAREGIKAYEKANDWGQYSNDGSYAVVKVADFLEALLFLREEKDMGNRSVMAVYQDVKSGFIDAWTDFPWDTGRLGQKPIASEFLTTFEAELNLSIHPSLEC